MGLDALILDLPASAALRFGDITAQEPPPSFTPRIGAVATRLDKLAVRYEATVLSAVIGEWL